MIKSVEQYLNLSYTHIHLQNAFNKYLKQKQKNSIPNNYPHTLTHSIFWCRFLMMLILALLF